MRARELSGRSRLMKKGERYIHSADYRRHHDGAELMRTDGTGHLVMGPISVCPRYRSRVIVTKSKA